MKTLSSFVGLLSFVGQDIFSSLIVNDTETPDFKYIRDIGSDPHYSILPSIVGKVAPVENLTSDDMICNRDIKAGPKTLTATVTAGDEVGFKTGKFIGDDDNPVFHPGGAQIYMSKSPDDIEHYDGKGDWFKIAIATEAQIHLKNKFKFNIPKTTPPGKYLLRIEQMWPLSNPGETQFYISCAHINVIGPGGGKPTEFIRFPGGYKATDPAILGTTKGTSPGPAVWQG